jgi:hypothetical protein
MYYTALCCDLHRVDVWELLPPRVAWFFPGEGFSEVIDERGGNGYAESGETGGYGSCGLSWQYSYTCKSRMSSLSRSCFTH